MINASMLPLFSTANTGYSSQMALFGLNQTAANSSSADATLALADRIGSSNGLSQSDKSGLMRLMATVEKFAGSNKDGLLQKVGAIASMTEMLNSNKGVSIDPFNPADSLELYWQQQSEVANAAVQIAPETEIKSLISGLKAQLGA
jgi:hypothetical protein